MGESITMRGNGELPAFVCALLVLSLSVSFARAQDRIQLDPKPASGKAGETATGAVMPFNPNDVEEWNIERCRQELESTLEKGRKIEKDEILALRRQIEEKKNALKSQDGFSDLALEVEQLRKKWMEKQAELDKKLDTAPEVKSLVEKRDALGGEWRKLVVLEARVRNRIRLLEAWERERAKLKKTTDKGAE